MGKKAIVHEFAQALRELCRRYSVNLHADGHEIAVVDSYGSESGRPVYLGYLRSGSERFPRPAHGHLPKANVAFRRKEGLTL